MAISQSMQWGRMPSTLTTTAAAETSTRFSSSALPFGSFFFNQARQQQVRIVPRCGAASPSASSSKQLHQHRGYHDRRHGPYHYHHDRGAAATAGGRRRKTSSRSSTTTAVLCNPSDEASCGSAERVAILWFKKDLRLDDHQGLSSTSAYHTLLPVYIFDPYLLRGWSNDLLKALVEAVADLKLALQGLGSDLIIRRGSIKHELCALAEEVHASVIITEEEIEHEWRDVVSSLSDRNLKADMHWFQMLKVESWKGPMYEVEWKQLPSSYREFQKMRCPINPPLKAPTSLPALPKVLEKGYVPSVSAVEDDVRVMLENNIWHRKLKELQTDGAEALLKTEEEEKGGTPSSKSQKTGGGILEGFNTWRERYILASPYDALDKRREELAVNSNGKEVIKSGGVGAASAMASLDAYLRFLEPTWRTDWKKLNEAVMDAESKGPRGASFRTLFGSALTLGTISRRRVYHEAFEYEKARNGGLSSPFGFSTFTAAAAVQEVKSAEVGDLWLDSFTQFFASL